MTTFRSLSFRPFATAATCLALTTVLAQTNNIAVNRDGAAPHPHGLLDVQSNYLLPQTQKGVLIPRMIDTERDAIAAPANGLTVYVTAPTSEEGFWFFDNGIWNRIMPGSPWDILGNTGTVPGVGVGQNYLGTSDAQPLVFRTNNLERARVDLQGDFGVGVINPVEKLDLLGAIKQTGTAATNTPGTIRYTTYNVPASPPWPAYAYSQHEGNINGTPTGWRKIENDYNEVKGASYSAAGSPVTCGPGAVVMPVANSTSATSTVSPWTTITSGAQRFRHQYLLRASDLNIELNQIFGNPAATQGLCAGAQISHVAFNLLVNPGNRTGNFSVTIKHSTSTSLTGFDNAVDPAERCFLAPSGQPTAGVGWKAYGPFATPFVWDGIRSIIIDIQCANGAGGWATNPTVQTRNGLGYNATYSTWGAACAGSGLCGGLFTGCGTNGSATEIPVIQFTTVGNGVSTAPPATVSSGDYVNYHGGLIAEVNPTFSTQTAPFFAFRGWGTITAEAGVYDDQVQLSDHVFDRHFDGRVMPQDAEMHGTGRNMSLEEMAAFTEQERHLPTIKGRQDWQAKGGFGLGDITNQLWTTTETQALYITDLNKRLDGLAVLAGNGPIDQSQYAAAKEAISNMGTLNEAEKALLVHGCAARLAAQATKH